MAKAKTAAQAPQIEYIHIDKLIPYARNSRTHSDEQIAQIAASILEFGFTNMVLYDKDGIVAGHGRVRGADRIYKAGGTFKTVGGFAVPREHIPCINCDGWTKAQRRAYIIADNKIALNAGWDADLLKLEIGDLNEEGFDLSLTGFDTNELERLLAPNPAEGLTDENETPAAPERPCVEPGDVWLLGGHRLVCGDSTSATDVEKLLGTVKPSLMVTDPPYGVSYDPNRRAIGMTDNAERAMGKVENDDRADWREAWALFPGDVAYVWHGMKTASVVDESLRAAGFELRAQIVWKKTRPALSPGNINPKSMGYNAQHECAFYVCRKGGRVKWEGDRSQSTVWEVDHPKSETGHGTQKPVEVMRRPIENNSSPGQVVYEPFCGSGTTIIAAEQTGRVCFAMEISPAYVEVSILRWQSFTGKYATLEATGETFTEVMAKRTPDKVVKLKGANDKKKAKKK